MNMYGATDIGKVRDTNQDAFYIDSENNWCVVADGMGGHRGGETASSMTVEIIKENMANGTDLKTAIEKANEEVYRKSLADKELFGMGTTVVLLRLTKNGAEIAHVGDSRAYLVMDGVMEQITVDHSIVQQLVDSGTITKEEAKNHPQRNLITRAVGTEREILTDVDKVTLYDGDYILICSDGLSSYVDESEIAKIISETPFEDTPQALIKAANEQGGRDNITVVIVRRNS